jgi:hypothetical protein
MSSGLGLNGEVSRCFYFFEDFTNCMQKDSTPLKNCGELRDDYLECLHNRRVIHKLNAAKQMESGHGGGSGHGHGHGGGH